MARKRSYSIIRFLIVSLYAVAILLLLGGLALAVYLWLGAEALCDGRAVGGFLGVSLEGVASGQLRLWAVVVALEGGIGFLLFGTFGQILAMQRDRAICAAHQVQLLEDILELNEPGTTAPGQSRVDLCQGCGRLGALHPIESGQWVCRGCRRQFRSS